jgi:hypothetical protein
MKTYRTLAVIVLFLGFLFSATSCAVRVQPENRTTHVRWYQSSPTRDYERQQRYQQRYQRHPHHHHRSNQVIIDVERR